MCLGAVTEHALTEFEIEILNLNYSVWFADE